MEKISVSDLSVGDYIRVKMCKWDYDDPDTLDAKVLSIEGNSVGVGYDECGIVMSAFVEDLQPIPITAMVLEKNGWQPPRKGVDLDTWWWTNREDKAIEAYEYDGEWYLTIIKQKEIQYRNKVGIGLKYIHELQHALRLAKVGKEIIL